MNKQLQRWLDRPGWQLYLYQWGVLGLMGLGVYSMLLRLNGNSSSSALRKLSNTNNRLSGNSQSWHCSHRYFLFNRN